MNPDRKLLKSAVGFEHPGMGEDECKDCTYYLPHDLRCRIVEGEVLPQDWCRKFKKGGPSIRGMNE